MLDKIYNFLTQGKLSMFMLKNKFKLLFKVFYINFIANINIIYKF